VLGAPAQKDLKVGCGVGARQAAVSGEVYRDGDAHQIIRNGPELGRAGHKPKMPSRIDRARCGMLGRSTCLSWGWAGKVRAWQPRTNPNL